MSISITPTLSTELCKYGDCEGSSCSLEEARSLQELALPALFKREMRGPENYGGDVTRFFVTELYNAKASGQLLNYQGSGGAARLEYFREQDLTTGVVGLYGCTSIIIVSKGAVWVSHWWEDPLFTAESFREFRDRILTPLVEGTGSENGDERIPGLGGLTGPTQPFEALYEPRAFLVSVRQQDGPNIFEYAGKIRVVELKLKSLMPNIRITTYKYRRNRKATQSSRAPNGKILIQYSATEPDCERKYRIWVEAQEALEESWPAAEGLPCRSSSTITSSDYSTSTFTSSSLLVVEASTSTSTSTSSDYSTSSSLPVVEASTSTSTSTSSDYSTSTSTSSSASPTSTPSTPSTTSSAATSAPSRNASCIASSFYGVLSCVASIASGCLGGDDGVQRCVYK
jgi:hypothetical protein